MIRVREVKVKVEDKNKLNKKIANKLDTKVDNIKNFKILKESIDARRKPEIYYVYEVAVELFDYNNIRNLEEYIEEKYELKAIKRINKPIIVGSGPAGLFAAYMLAMCGCNPIIIERGEKIEDRVKSVDEFWKSGKLNLNSNFLFLYSC